MARNLEPWVPVDLLVAAVADRHWAAVLHYEGDYDLIAKHTDLSFEASGSPGEGARGSLAKVRSPPPSRET